MEGKHAAGASNQASPIAVGLNGSVYLSNLMSSVSDNHNSGLNLIDLPLSFSAYNGCTPNITFAASDDLLVSLNSLTDANIYKMSDNSYINSSELMSKRDAKSPLSIMVGADGIHIQGQSSPVITTQSSMHSGLHFHSVVSGGDKMLSAVNSLNFNDPEMLGDSAFDSTSSSGLPQFEDGLLSSLGSTGQGMRLGDGPGGTSFDLFDGGVTDSLSLSPQPFPETSLISDSASSVLDSGLMQHSGDMDEGGKSPGRKNSTGSLSDQSKFGSSQCSACGKTFSNIGALAKHKLTHSDERKYVCNVCSKGFKRQDHLNGHLMTHLDKKPYECQLANCDKGYCDARSLRRHLEQHHHLDPQTIQTHVQASMAAAGISPPAPRNGGKKNSDGRNKHLSSPVYSPGSATPTPSPGASGAGNVFHFDTQQLKTSQQQQKQQELMVQQIHQQQKLLLQQQQQQKQQQEEKAKEQMMSLQSNDTVTQQIQLQLQQHRQKPQTDMLAAIQQVQQIHQVQLEAQKKKAAAEKDLTSVAMSSVQDVSWQDKAGVYTFVGTPTSNEQSPTSRNDQSPSGVILSGELPARSPVSPVTIQPVSPLTGQSNRTNIWYNADNSASVKMEEQPKTQAYCTTCDRYFKNAAALNGHMRCHGGFLKKGKEKEGKKSPMRKSSLSEMGPPLRRPPHTSTPSPQPAIPRTSPTTPTSLTFSPTQLVAGQQVEYSTVDIMSVGSPSDQQLQNFTIKSDPSLTDTALPQQKHKHLQEQLSSHILKRRMSEEQQQRRQQQQQKTLQQQQQQQQQFQHTQQHLQLSQDKMCFLEQQNQLQEQVQQNIQFMASQLLDSSSAPMTIETLPVRTASPHQGEHIQRLVQSFQQVEELQRQQQQQDELPQLSAEQLEQIRHQHKLLGLPPLNPQQLQYQLQEQQNQLLQAQIREQQLQEQQQQQQQQQQIQELDQGAVIMAANHPGLLQQLNTTQITSAPLSMAISSQPLSLPAQSILQLSNQTNEPTDNRASISSQIALNTSVQQILAALDPSVVRAAGINLNDHQHLLEQLQKQQQTQQELLGLQVQSQVTGIAHPSGILSGLHIGQIPQILLQPPDSDDMNGVPTISIPESVVLGSDSSSVMQASSESEQEQIKRIQNGLMASQPKRQQEALMASHAHPSLVQTLESGMIRTNHLDQTGIPNFLNIQAPSTHSNLGSQNHFDQLRDGIIQGSSSSNSIQQDPGSFLLTSSSPAGHHPSSTSSTDAVVAQILKNISNSMAESSNADNMDYSSSRGSALENILERPTYQPFQGYPSSFSKTFKDSIKQDVMLSSAVTSDLNRHSLCNEPLAKDDVPYTSKPTKVHYNGQGNKRRLSADLESHRRHSSIFSILNKPNQASINPHSTLVNPMEVEGICSARVRVRSKSGDINYKYVRSKSVDHSPMRPRSFTEESLYRSNPRLEETFIKSVKSNPDEDLFPDGSGVFRNPSSSPLKIKRKHRPAPLYIPPQFGLFHSRLRSPRVLHKEGHISLERGKGHTPPPYTPPPMLSPFRSGSGLFCTLHSAQPQTPRSAPVSGKALFMRRGSLGSGKTEGIVEFLADQTTKEEPAPETDTEAHINIGPDYQAVLPLLRDKSKANLFTPVDEKKNLLWDPSSEGDNTDAQLQCYQEFSCSAAIKGNGCNVEYALHLLHLANGEISDAMLMLMADPPDLPPGHPMLDYKYQESDSWNSNEMEKFYKSIMTHDKDFFKVAKEVATKSVKQCIQFYYVWKKVCPDDYKRLRHSRNKQGEYNTRRQAERAAAQAAVEKTVQAAFIESQSEGPAIMVAPREIPEENLEAVDSDAASFMSDNDDLSVAPDSIQSTAPNTANSTPTRMESPLPPPQFHCTFEGCNVACSSKQSLKRHMRKHQDKPQSSPSAQRKPRPSTPSRSPVYDQFGEEIFPCRICGRVFAKVKSRSAHMKSHKIAEQSQNERKVPEMAVINASFISS
ncbi:uncharacterized protein LOC131929789 isoform X2 [Physella acuta]|uniref:uncharacterized protein LOC131929789 isoform X2 n=1 Tax=Physella acuta TaxID=109671 RepID=UPI0027DE084E|nr:uncharacterized protein LOC131929789 isoform X2 [Physella acuta]